MNIKKTNSNVIQNIFFSIKFVVIFLYDLLYFHDVVEIQADLNLETKGSIFIDGCTIRDQCDQGY